MIYLPRELSDPFPFRPRPLASGVFSISQKNLRKRHRGKREKVVLRKRQNINMSLTPGSFDGGTLTLNTKITMLLVGGKGR